MKLRPITFIYKPEYANGEPALRYGLLAEEVAKVYPELVAHGTEGNLIRCGTRISARCC